MDGPARGSRAGSQIESRPQTARTTGHRTAVPGTATHAASPMPRSASGSRRSSTTPLLRLRVPALAVLAVMVIGTIGYVVIERYSLLDAVFMTIITVTTVGYDEVHPLDGPGKVFTIGLIVLGVVVFLYTFGVVVEELSSGRWREWRRQRMVEERIARLRDHVIVCGYGRTGSVIGRELDREGAEFVVVEANPDGLERVEREGRLCVIGDAADDEVLERAGIRRARALITAVDSDERNVYIVLTARSLNPDLRIVARSSYQETVSKLRRAGANRVVSPYTEAGQRMAALALNPAVVDVIQAVVGEGGPLSIEELVVPDGARETTARELRRSGATLLALRHPGGQLVVGPADEDRLSAGDLVIALGSRDQLAALAAMVTRTD